MSETRIVSLEGGVTVLTASAADILSQLAEIAGVDLVTLVGSSQDHDMRPLRSTAVELLRSDAGLNNSQVARVFGRTLQWASWWGAGPIRPGRGSSSPASALGQASDQTRRRHPEHAARTAQPCTVSASRQAPYHGSRGLGRPPA